MLCMLPASLFLLNEELGPGKLTEVGMKNMAGPLLAGSGMWFWPPFVQGSLKLRHSHVLLAHRAAWFHGD